MNQFMIDYTKNNVVCNTGQDDQYLFRPSRVSPNNGVLNTFESGWLRIDLPVVKTRFHIYQIGFISPSTLALPMTKGVWLPVSEIMKLSDININVFIETGVQLPKDSVYLYIDSNGNLVVAVRDNIRYVDMIDSIFFIRFYSNAFFKSSRATSPLHFTDTDTIIVSNRADIVTFQNKIAGIVGATSENTILTHNGMVVSNFVLDSILLGDVLEYVVDTSIKKVVKYVVSNLETFSSEIDNQNKYLLFRNIGSTDTIDFKDDIDVYLEGKTTKGYRGVFIGPDSLRMLTHKDYSIPTSLIHNKASLNESFIDSAPLNLTLVIRESGLKRELVKTEHKVHELMALEDSDAYNAILGTNSTLDMWKASYLEQHPYVKAMSANPITIGKSTVTEIFGYDSISSLVGKSVIKVIDKSGVRGVEVPDALQVNSTVFEYDVSGILIGYYKNTEGGFYKVKHLATTLVEILYGQRSTGSSITYAEDCVILGVNLAYECYICDIVNGAPTYDWRIAVDLVDFHYRDNQITWLVDKELFYTAVKTNNEFLLTEHSVNNLSGAIELDIISTDTILGVERTLPLSIKPERVDVFLNGRSLVPKVDYHINWPTIVIVNTEFLNPLGQLQDIVIRTYGFSDKELNLYPVLDTGYVKNGVLSNNVRYDVRDDRNITISVRGSLIHKEDLHFDEHTNSVYVNDSVVTDGDPYVIQEVVVPLTEYIDTNTLTYREQSRVANKQVSDYLSLYRDKVVRTDLSTIPKSLLVVSPLVARTLYLIETGLINPVLSNNSYSSAYVRDLLKDISYLLKYEPLAYTLDDRYVTVIPHVRGTLVKLSYNDFRFIEKVIDVYLGGKVDLNNYIVIDYNL